jgi:hypothetical protein
MMSNINYLQYSCWRFVPIISCIGSHFFRERQTMSDLSIQPSWQIPAAMTPAEMNQELIDSLPEANSVQGLRNLGEIQYTDANGQQQWCGVSTTGILGQSANALTSSDKALIYACTGAQFGTSPEGVEMTLNYSPDVALSSQQISASLATFQTTNSSPNFTPSGLRAAAMGSAEYTGCQNFVNALASLRQSLAPNQPITPSMLIAMAKQASTNGAPIPQEYIANAIGYLNGLSLT